VADTGFYYHVAYTLAAVLYGGYLASLWRRRRAVRERRARLAADLAASRGA
jgi:hypothetical protein